MNRNLVIIGVVIIVLIAGAVLFAGQQSKQVPTQAPTGSVQEETPSPTAVAEEGGVVGKASVEISNFAFGPKTLTIKKGTTVTWTNQDSVAHTATSDDGGFDTGLLAKGKSESVTFDELGTYTYHCTPHPYIKATIIVE